MLNYQEQYNKNPKIKHLIGVMKHWVSRIDDGMMLIVSSYAIEVVDSTYESLFVLNRQFDNGDEKEFESYLRQSLVIHIAQIHSEALS